MQIAVISEFDLLFSFFNFVSSGQTADHQVLGLMVGLKLLTKETLLTKALCTLLFYK
jgi:hypothetical protein